VRFKLDENLSRHAADLICTAGHDAVTVTSQGLRGAADETLFEVCRRESRTLVTLDHDFGPSNPRVYGFTRGSFDLLDEIEQSLALDVTPASWPIGITARRPRSVARSAENPPH
jgi:peptide subunit release factor RF-3